MSQDIETMAHMVNNRVADIEATREIERRQNRLEAALEKVCRALTGKPRPTTEKHHPESSTDEDL